MENFTIWLHQIRDWVWGPPLIILLVGTGIYLTFILKGLQFRYLGYALKLAFSRHDDNAKGDISHFQSLMTALAATIGIGSIAGVATAITVGGLGALFWMVVAALFGMATKYAEAILAVKYRAVDGRGEMSGGPMYYIQQGLKWKWLAVLFAFFGAGAALGTGAMVQANSISDAVVHILPLNTWWIGIAIAVSTGAVLLGGIKKIGKVAGILVPVMASFYLAGGLAVLAIEYERVPAAFFLIIESAFTGQAAMGGFIGSTIMVALQMGVARGVFASESGLGTASIAAAAAKTDTPGRQAMISMTGSFITVAIVCTITGLVIAVTDVVGTTGASGKLLNGVPLTVAAFNAALPWGGAFIVLIGAILFAYTTIIGWGYYGEKCFEYLFGTNSTIIYRILYILVLIPGAAMSLDSVWAIADIMNGLMAVPNLIALIALSGVITQETRQFLAQVKQEEASAKALANMG